MVLDRLDEESDGLLKHLVKIPDHIMALEVRIDGVPTLLPHRDDLAGTLARFDRSAKHSVRISLTGPPPDTSFNSPDLLEWTREAVRHLMDPFNLLAPPLDVDTPGSHGFEAMMFPEGARMYRIHVTRERCRQLVSLAKRAHAARNDGRLPCEICGFDFTLAYGDRGAAYAEAHHRLPLSESREGRESRVEDLAIVCANCHRMLHRSPFMTVEELHDLLDARHRANPGGQPEAE